MPRRVDKPPSPIRKDVQYDFGMYKRQHDIDKRAHRERQTKEEGHTDAQGDIHSYYCAQCVNTSIGTRRACFTSSQIYGEVYQGVVVAISILSVLWHSVFDDIWVCHYVNNDF